VAATCRTISTYCIAREARALVKLNHPNAVAAAASSAFSVISGVPAISHFMWARVEGTKTGFTILDLLVLIGIAVPALTGMILGAVAWVRIKDSEGAFRGLRLAQLAMGESLGLSPTLLKVAIHRLRTLPPEDPR
jgi:hypothetical protein